MRQPFVGAGSEFDGRKLSKHVSVAQPHRFRLFTWTDTGEVLFYAFRPERFSSSLIFVIFAAMRLVSLRFPERLRRLALVT